MNTQDPIFPRQKDEPLNLSEGHDYSVIVAPLVARAPSGGHLNALVISTRYFLLF